MSRRRPQQSNRRVWPLYLAGLIGLYLLGSSWWWYTWPDRTWNAFTQALADRDIAAANRLCDADSLQVAVDRTGARYFKVKSFHPCGPHRYLVDAEYYGDMLKFRDKNGPHRSSLWQIVNAEMPLSKDWRMRIWFGGLYFKRGKIEFRPY